MIISEALVTVLGSRYGGTGAPIRVAWHFSQADTQVEPASPAGGRALGKAGAPRGRS